MGRLFGTDGIRGVANTELNCELAMDVGRAAAAVLTAKSGHKATFLIGKDTRISGDMLEAALCAGICSVGADVRLLGVVPTPAVAYLVKHYGADAGFVISASHNSFEFNGIKLFNGEGYKLSDEIEEEIESYILERKAEIHPKTHEGIGRIIREDCAAQDYAEYIVKECGSDLSGLRIAFDCANGAASVCAKDIFDKMNADCIYSGCSPDGININAGVGSTHLDALKKIVLENNCDIGVAFDGDADRCLCVDENGNDIDGDMMIGVMASFLKSQGKLSGNAAVVTVMTNLGFVDYCKKYGIETVRTAVGDRYVLEEMMKSGYSIGGEQSGHIILLDHATTGDGEMSAAVFLRLLKESGKKASELIGEMKQYPQVLKNIRTTAAGKAAYLASKDIKAYIEAEDKKLGDNGRIVARVSGTEPLIRIMTEGKDMQETQALCDRIVAFVQSEIEKC